jgi:hypothetical protein
MSLDMPEQREQGSAGTDEVRQDVAGFGPSWRRSDDQHTLSFSEIDRVTGQNGGQNMEEESWKPRKNWLESLTGSLNFYRIHLIAFTFVSLTILSADREHSGLGLSDIIERKISDSVDHVRYLSRL